MGESQLQVASTPLEAFVISFGWGHLKDHMMPCDDCDGHGKDEDDEDCHSCSSEGEIRWGSFYHEDVGKCAHCDGQTVPVSKMYDDNDCYESGWVCLPCYVDHHRQACQCNLWKRAEEALATARAAMRETLPSSVEKT